MELDTEKVPIKLSWINGKALCFIADDYITIRSEHHIVGKLIGIPVSNATNLSVNGLPAFYNDYEVKLMLEEGLVVLEDKTGLKLPPSNGMRDLYAIHLKNNILDSHKPYIEDRLKIIKVNMENIIAGKRKKLLKSGIPKEGEIVYIALKELYINYVEILRFVAIEIHPEDIIRDETAKIAQAMSSKSTFVQVPTQHPFKVSSTTVKDFPVENISKYKVFKDLWSKGFFITNGDSFGCDFLTYPGDPISFHASQIVNVVDQHKQYDINYLVSCSRLSVSVKKKCVFAYTSNNDTITYQTTQWDNPKLKQLYSTKCDNSQEREVPDETS